MPDETYPKHWPHLGIEAISGAGFVDDQSVFLASIAISMKRIADAVTMCDQYGMTGSASIAQAIQDGLRGRG